MIDETQSIAIWYIPLNIPSKKPTEKAELIFLEIEFLQDTGATSCILITQTWNAIKIYLAPSEYELKQDVDTKLRTANS